MIWERTAVRGSSRRNLHPCTSLRSTGCTIWVPKSAVSCCCEQKEGSRPANKVETLWSDCIYNVGGYSFLQTLELSLNMELLWKRILKIPEDVLNWKGIKRTTSIFSAPLWSLRYVDDDKYLAEDRTEILQRRRIQQIKNHHILQMLRTENWWKLNLYGVVTINASQNIDV